MVELIVVMALVTILVGIALPRIDFERARVRSAANALVTVLSAAQSRAVLNQHDVVIRFDTVAGSALVHLDPGETFVSESGAMFRASSNVDIDVTTKTRGKGGLLAGIKRLVGGVFINQRVDFFCRHAFVLSHEH